MSDHIVPLILGLLALQGAPKLNLEEVARANEDSVAAIHSIVVKVKSFQTQPRSSNPDTLVEAVESTYRLHEGKARKTTDNKLGKGQGKATEAGDRMGYSDVTSGPGGSRTIFGYDPSAPPKLGEYSLSKASGVLDNPDPGRHPLGNEPLANLFLQILEGGRPYTLRELIAGASSARLTATPEASALGCYEIEVKRPLMNYRIHVDPALNFMIRKIENTSGSSVKVRGGAVTEAFKFRDYGDGVFLPSVLEGEGTEEGHPSLKIRVELQVVSCNEPVPAEEFEVKFPDWLPVLDKRSGQIHRWGPDDKPRLTFATAEEYRKWDIPRMEQAARMQRPWSVPWYLIAGSATIVLMVVLRVMKRRAAMVGA